MARPSWSVEGDVVTENDAEQKHGADVVLEKVTITLAAVSAVLW